MTTSADLRTSCTACPGEAVLAYGFPALIAGSGPEAMGAVGPNHVMTMNNFRVQIQLKSGAIVSSVSSTTFWSPLPFGAGGFPQLIYDAPSGRWIATAGAGMSPTTVSVGLAVSASDDPTGAWTFYLLPGDPSEQPVFPRFGINGTWIALTALGGSPGNYKPKMWVIDKSTALAGGPFTLTVFPTGFDGNTIGELGLLQPCVTLDAAEPTLYIVNNNGLDPSDNTNLLRLSRITGTASSPVWSPVPGSVNPGTGVFRVANAFSLTPTYVYQCETGRLDAADSSLHSNTVLRNGRIWAVHHGWIPASGTPDRTAGFWYQIDPLAMPNPLVQSGVIDGGAGVHHICPSIGVNCANDACVGFTRVSSQICAQGAFCTRLASDALGTMRAVGVLRRGVGPFGYDFFFTYNWGAIQRHGSRSRG
jgi:hypothetical protein